MSKIFIDTDELQGLARDIRADAANLAGAGLDVVRVKAELEALQAGGQLPRWTPEQSSQMNKFLDALNKLGGGLGDIAGHIDKYAGAVQSMDLSGGIKPGAVSAFVLGSVAGAVGIPTQGKASSHGMVGWETHGEGSVNIGGATIEGGYSLKVGAGYDASAEYRLDGSGIHGKAHAGGFVGVEAEAWGSIQYGPLGAKGHTKSTTGSSAEADALGGAGWGDDGPQADLGLSGKAMAGEEWNADASADFGFGGATAGAGFKAGIGVQADVGASFGADKIGFHADVGASLGIGLELKIDISINPASIVEGAFDFAKGIADDPFGSIGSAFHDVGSAFSDVGSAFKDVGGAIGDIGSGMGDVASSIGSGASDFVDGIGDAIGSIF